MLDGQLTLRGLAIGCIGCVVITASSAYVALKMGALPWPIIFAAVVSLFFLKAVSRGTSTLNEANVTHTVMSAGAMVAGGLAFTIPGAWMLGLADEIGVVQMLAAALSGVLLGLVYTAALRRRYVEDAQLEFPVGEAAAQTLIAGERGGRTGRRLFGSMGLAGAFALLRDGLGAVPSMVAALPVPGVAFGIYLSPMMLSVGFLVGAGSVAAWLAGALLGNLGVIAGGSLAGLWDVAGGQAVSSSLGMGLMMGCGIAVVACDILPRGASLLRAGRARAAGSCGGLVPAAGLAALAVAAAVLALTLALGLPPLASAAVVLLSFAATAMSAQSVGRTGIDPMEVFGLIVLLLVAALCDVAQAQLFLVAAVVAVACGLAGDVMNDFRAGRVLGTSPRAQWAGQAVGGVLGALVAVGVVAVLLSAYGPDAFGPGREFAAAQASVVAAMVSGVPHVGAFALGLALGFALHLAKLPAMMLGLGVYLPFYMSLTASLGAVTKLAYDAWCRRRAEGEGLAGDELEARLAEKRESGLVMASGLLGGESIVGIVIALVVALGALA